MGFQSKLGWELGFSKSPPPSRPPWKAEKLLDRGGEILQRARCEYTQSNISKKMFDCTVSVRTQRHGFHVYKQL